uniref:Exonuclease 3'-5' domain containing 3 n=1 Tax=Salarias fasciatus TaxID=181472 RepID=A0A672IWC8_SALFA
GQSHLEQQLVALLDSWCHPTCSMEEIRKCVQMYPLSCALLLPQTVPSCLSFQTLDKPAQLQTAHQTRLCPNALHNRRLDSLRFLMYKTFVEVNDTVLAVWPGVTTRR